MLSRSPVAGFRNVAGASIMRCSPTMSQGVCDRSTIASSRRSHLRAQETVGRVRYGTVRYGRGRGGA
jgi:hypothetical protein